MLDSSNYPSKYPHMFSDTYMSKAEWELHTKYMMLSDKQFCEYKLSQAIDIIKKGK